MNESHHTSKTTSNIAFDKRQAGAVNVFYDISVFTLVAQFNN